jgi:potassium uptake TrkH family protein
MKPKEPVFWDRFKPLVERLNTLLYPSKPLAYKILKLVSRLNVAIGAALVIYGYGFDLSQKELRTVFYAVDFSLVFFLLVYLLRILYSFRRADFLRRTWFEGILMLLIAVNGASHLLLNYRFLEEIFRTAGVQEPYEFYRIALMLFMLLLLTAEAIKLTTKFSSIQIKPASLFIGSFILLIAVGTCMLMLPALNVSGEQMPIIDALFTAVSAACVTGLTVVDTYSYFTLKGQIMLLLLFQLGGLGIVSFATFFATFIRNGVGLKHQSIIQDFLSSESLSSSKGLLRQIVLITVSVELIGALLIYLTWPKEFAFNNPFEKIFFAIFHSVSAFCNAGFSVIDGGFTHPLISNSYLMQVIVCAIIFIGGIGFPVLQDVCSISKMRERLKYPWKDWKLGSKIAIYTSIGLILFGSAWFFVLEFHQSLVGKSFTEKILFAFFHSVNARTSGFNSLDLSLVSTPTVILFVFLMFVGASPGSTGGGIKTTTFYLIVVTALATIQGKKSIEIDRRTISNDLVFKAFAVFTFAASFNIVAIFFLSIAEPGFAVERLVFEQFSAFATVGLSTGITPLLGAGGKLVLVISMFVGRIGLLTLALSLSNKVISTSYKYPNEHVMVA